MGGHINPVAFNSGFAPETDQQEGPVAEFIARLRIMNLKGFARGQTPLAGARGSESKRLQHST